MSAPEKLAEYVRSLPDFKIYESTGGSYNHMGATIADAVLQANNKYDSNVTPRTNRILAVYPEAKTTSAIHDLLATVPATVFLNWSGADRAKRLCEIVELFKSEAVETEADLQGWLTHSQNCAKLDGIYGVGQKTVDYFKILAGESTSAIDRHMLGFLELAGIKAANYDEAQQIIIAAADLLGIDRANFDHSIWQFMQKGTAARECKTNPRTT